MATKKKAKKTQIQLVKGMKDILPDDQLYWNVVKEKVFKGINSMIFSEEEVN